MLKKTATIAAVLVCTFTTAALTQEPPPTTAQSRASDARAVLKLTILLSRFQGDKKIGSLPYTMTVATNHRANLRMGSEVPMLMTIYGGGGSEKAPQTSFNYRSLGTNIDCTAGGVVDGAYQITLTVEDSSAHFDPAQKPVVAMQKSDIPSYRTFKSSFTVLLRDGQTMQNTSAADPISGEVMKVDVTLNVMK